MRQFFLVVYRSKLCLDKWRNRFPTRNRTPRREVFVTIVTVFRLPFVPFSRCTLHVTWIEQTHFVTLLNSPRTCRDETNVIKVTSVDGWITCFKLTSSIRALALNNRSWQLTWSQLPQIFYECGFQIRFCINIESLPSHGTSLHGT